jgi:hypothetical protein
MEPHSIDFLHWLVGLTDGDGCFSVLHQGNSWSFIYKISLSTYNLRALFFIKKNLCVGSVTIDKKNHMGSFLIRNKNVLSRVIFPIFDKYPLLTTKYFFYLRMKNAFSIINNSLLTKSDQDRLLFNLLEQKPPIDYISPVWNLVLPLSSSLDAKKIISKGWLVGFIEAEGSFYITRKGVHSLSNSFRFVHGFVITQKLDPIVLEAIRLILHITSKVHYLQKHHFYILDTTQKRSIQNICLYFHANLFSIKSFEFNLWKRSFLRQYDSSKLSHVQTILRNIRERKNYKYFDSDSFSL